MSGTICRCFASFHYQPTQHLLSVPMTVVWLLVHPPLRQPLKSRPAASPGACCDECIQVRKHSRTKPPLYGTLVLEVASQCNNTQPLRYSSQL
eukprot:SAG31_NODE_26137_length_447_cov_2.068966_1_plen_92_part_10